MCGIVGAMAFSSFSKKAEEKIRQESMMFITTNLLQQTVVRGEDATGVAMLFDDCNYIGLKMGIKSTEFIARYGETDKDFKGLLKVWREYPKPVRVYLGHCRKASVGSALDNKNNHPIRVGDTIAIKNGTLKNHDVIFEKLKCGRDGEVDSEAVVRLLHAYTEDGKKPFTANMLKEVTKRLDGPYSVLGVCANNPFQVAQFKDLKPAFMVLVRPLKTVFVASEKKFLENALYEYLKIGNLMEPTVKFAKLEAKDMDWLELTENSVAVWDLTTDVKEDTELKDLYVGEKSAYPIDRIWKESTTKTTTNYGSGVNNDYNRNKSIVNAGPVNKTDANNSNDDDDDDDDDGNTEGMAWSDKFKRFKTQKRIQETKEMGSVEISPDNGDVKCLDPNGNLVNFKPDEGTGVKGLERVATDKVEDLVADSASVKEIAADTVSKAAKEAGFTAKSGAKKSKSSSGKSNEGSGKQSKVKIIDMSTDPEALKRADEFVNAGLVKYSNEKELLADIEFGTDRDDWIHNLPPHNLANRIQMLFAKRYFYAGYRARKEEEVSVPGKETKDKNAEKKIRTLKIVTKLLVQMINTLNTPKYEDLARDALKMVIKSTNVLTTEQIEEAFSAGDIKNMRILQAIKKELAPQN